MRIHHPDRVGTGAGHGEHRGGVASGKEVMEAKEVKEVKEAKDTPHPLFLRK